MLDGEHANRAFEADDGHAGKAVEPFFAGLWLVEECRMLGGLGEIEDSPLGRNRSDQALAHPEAGDVNRFLAQAVGCEQLEIVVAEQINGADVADHLVSDEVDDLVELRLRGAALGHHRVETGQDLAGGRGSGKRHARALSDGVRACHAPRLSSPVPAGDRHPLRFLLHLGQRLIGDRLVEFDPAFLGGSPHHPCERIERADDHEDVAARRRKVAGVELSTFGRQIRDDHRARASQAKGRAGKRHRLALMPSAANWCGLPFGH
jgi:hypothetical protein